MTTNREVKPWRQQSAESEKRTAVAELRIAQQLLSFGCSSEFDAYQDGVRAVDKDSVKCRVGEAHSRGRAAHSSTIAFVWLFQRV